MPEGRLLLQTLRSHDQFNTTIYGLDDRYRGIHGGRRVVFVHPDDTGRARARATARSSTWSASGPTASERRAPRLPGRRLPDRRGAARRPTSRRPTCWSRWTPPPTAATPRPPSPSSSGWSATRRPDRAGAVKSGSRHRVAGYIHRAPTSRASRSEPGPMGESQHPRFSPEVLAQFAGLGIDLEALFSAGHLGQRMGVPGLWRRRPRRWSGRCRWRATPSRTGCCTAGRRRFGGDAGLGGRDAARRQPSKIAVGVDLNVTHHRGIAVRDGDGDRHPRPPGPLLGHLRGGHHGDETGQAGVHGAVDVHAARRTAARPADPPAAPLSPTGHWLGPGAPPPPTVIPMRPRT